MLLNADEVVLSRHRLPQPYRALLTLLWVAPAVLLMVTLLITHGASATDLRLAPIIGLMFMPALYIWREGVDITPSNLIRRIHLPQRYRYSMLTHWHYEEKTGVLKVWDQAGHVALECRAGHLTDFAQLIELLGTYVRACADDRSDGQ